MNKKFSILLAALALVASILACSVGQMSLDNPRMSTDEPGKQTTTTYTPNQTFYAVADLNNATKGTIVSAKWYVVNVPGITPGFQDETKITIDQDYFTGYVSFKYVNSSGAWPPGEYRAELYLNGELKHTLDFKVQ